MVTFTSIGTVPDDHTAPKVRVTGPRRVSVSALIDNRVPLAVRTSEAGQLTVSLRIAGRSVGFGFATRDTPGVFGAGSFFATSKERRRLRVHVGRRAQVVVGINDLKGNCRRVVRKVRLTR